MAISDEEIGRNVVRLRGTITQKDLAERMRERGWKWSQATVWAVEKGDRPLRLAEAEDLSDILGVPSWQALSGTDVQSRFWSAFREVESLGRSLVVAIDLYLEAQSELAIVAHEARVDGIERAQVEQLLLLAPEELARQRRLHADLEEAVEAREVHGESATPPLEFTRDSLIALWAAEWRRRRGEHPEAS